MKWRMRLYWVLSAVWGWSRWMTERRGLLVASKLRIYKKTYGNPQAIKLIKNIILKIKEFEQNYPVWADKAALRQHDLISENHNTKNSSTPIFLAVVCQGEPRGLQHSKGCCHCSWLPTRPPQQAPIAEDTIFLNIACREIRL